MGHSMSGLFHVDNDLWYDIDSHIPSQKLDKIRFCYMQWVIFTGIKHNQKSKLTMIITPIKQTRWSKTHKQRLNTWSWTGIRKKQKIESILR